MTQLQLFSSPELIDQPTTHRHPHPNSLLTYRTAVEPHLTERQQQVLTGAQRFPNGFTHEQLCDALPGLTESSVRGRCADLVKAGLIYDTLTKALTRAGNPTTVWKVAT